MSIVGIQNTACFLFDLDGTVYLGDHLLPGAEELLKFWMRSVHLTFSSPTIPPVPGKITSKNWPEMD